MSKKVDFKNIVIKDINGQDTKADVTQLFGNMLYMQGQHIDECELGTLIYHQKKDEPIELDEKQVAIVMLYAERVPYVFREGIKKSLQ